MDSPDYITAEPERKPGQHLQLCLFWRKHKELNLLANRRAALHTKRGSCLPDFTLDDTSEKSIHKYEPDVFG